MANITGTKKSAYRLQVYKLIERIIGRTVTPEEHIEIKDILVAYVQLESGHVKGTEEAMRKQGQTIKQLRKTMLGKLYSFIDKEGIDEKKVEILKGLVIELKGDE